MTTTTVAGFTAANGEIIGPNGQPFIAKGINLYDSQIAAASEIQQLFPGVNMVRLAVQNYASPTAIASFVTQMTNAGIVVEIEDHSAPSANNNVLTGSALTNELNWYSSMASAFANNPFVWFGTMNEPNDTSNEAAVASQEQQIYNAIRSTGNNNPIMLEQIGGYTDNGLVASDYSNMTNVIWDTHYYGWVSGYSTSQSTVNADLAAQVANAQSITTAEGIVPVIIGEYGISTTGSGTDANASEVLSAVQGSGYGSLAWGFSAGVDQLVTGSYPTGGTLTSYGQEVANFIGTTPPNYSGGTSSNPTPTPTPAPTPSPNDTVVKAGSTAAITDASGNLWTITNGGQVAVNGVADTTTGNVVELAYVNGVIWQENSSALWWSEASSGAGWSPPGGTSTSPLPATPTPSPSPSPSPNDTVVKAGSTATITDASGNLWTITSGGQVAVNGVSDTTTGNVVELAYVSGVIWQENSSALWWSEASPGAGWAPPGGTSTSPLPTAPTPSPSPNDTVVKAGSTAAITDARGNLWTITSGGQVAVNGVSDATTTNVTALAYVNGVVWHENSSELWWSETSPGAGWAPPGGTSTSPLLDITIPGSTASVTENVSNATITATTGNHMVFIGGSGDNVMLTGGTEQVQASAGGNAITTGTGNDTITIGGTGNIVNAGAGTNVIKDNGSQNLIVLPATGKDLIYGSVLSNGDTLDLRAALSSTTWNGTNSTLSSYLSVTSGGGSTSLVLHPSGGKTGVTVATLENVGTQTLATVLQHSLT